MLRNCQTSALGQRLNSVHGRYTKTWRGNFERPRTAFLNSQNRPDSPAMPAHPLARPPQMARLEAVLVMAREPLTTRKLAQFAGLADGTEARTFIRRLNKLYDQGGTAFRVEEVAGGWQLMTRPQFGAWLQRLFRAPVATRLSAPAMETLAVVAYQQPVQRAEVEGVRGVDCGEILRQLMDRDFVRILGRSGDLGRPYLYGTTKRFLQVFGLRNLEELPRAEILRRKHRRAPGGVDSMTNQTSELVSE